MSLSFWNLMQPLAIPEALIFRLLNLSFQNFGEEKEYRDIISPFCRIYLVSGGTGLLLTGQEKTVLEAGNLYLIPAFAFSTYLFHPGLSQYYIHVSVECLGGLDPFSILQFRNKIKAGEIEYKLFERLCMLHPGLQLPHDDPRVYQTKFWLSKNVVYETPGHKLETIGILAQIFSRFIDPGSGYKMTRFVKYNIQHILHYIQTHLEEDITVDKLADIACLSKDHFSRVFKSITGSSPCDYVIRKRIERVQFLLLTTEMGIKEISVKTGFRSASYLTRIFKRQTNWSPARFRLQQGTTFQKPGFQTNRPEK